VISVLYSSTPSHITRMAGEDAKFRRRYYCTFHPHYMRDITIGLKLLGYQP